MIITTHFNTIWTYNILFYCFVGKKIIHFITRCDASRGRKSKQEGGGKSKAAQLYTPLENLPISTNFNLLTNLPRTRYSDLKQQNEIRQKTITRLSRQFFYIILLIQKQKNILYISSLFTCKETCSDQKTENKQ